MTRSDLVDVVKAALRHHGGEATVVEVCKYAWAKFEEDLKHSGDLFYTWQYDIRWAAQKLRDAGAASLGRRGKISTWKLN